MNLTKQLKAELVKAVVLDQFGDKIAELQKAVSQKASDHVREADKGFSKQVLDLAKSSGKEGCIPCHQNAWYMNSYSAHLRVLDDKIIIMSNNIPIDLTVVSVGKPIIPNELLETEVLKARELILKMESMADDLTVVLNGAKTIKKLQHLTNVFDPFLPKAAVKSNQLVPTEPLLRVNAIKTPKQG